MSFWSNLEEVCPIPWTYHEDECDGFTIEDDDGNELTSLAFQSEARKMVHTVKECDKALDLMEKLEAYVELMASEIRGQMYLTEEFELQAKKRAAELEALVKEARKTRAKLRGEPWKEEE